MMHIFSAKSKTKKQKIKELKDAPVFYVPLQQHIGTEAAPIVQIGETVKRFQQIGETSSNYSANVHSPVSGIVKDIIQHPLADGNLSTTIVIENDFQNTEIINDEDVDIESLSPQEILGIIKKAGIVGEGGAQFPTHIKYNIDNKEIETFIVNGTECEPYLTADYAVMSESANLLFAGILIINKVLKAKNIVITIEEQNKELASIFEVLLSKPEFSNFKIKILPNKYPQGGELQLIKSVTGKELGKGKQPSGIGMMVSNVGTIIAIYKAVVHHKPLVERIITISGNDLKGAGNYLVKIGTPIEHIIKELGLELLIDKSDIILGGPMMGKNITDLLVPVTKGSSGILNFVKKEIKRSNCISCGYCVDVCPMHLMPMKFEELYRKEKYASLSKFNLYDCIECAACEYICPSDVALMESIKEGKKQLNNLK